MRPRLKNLVSEIHFGYYQYFKKKNKKF